MLALVYRSIALYHCSDPASAFHSYVVRSSIRQQSQYTPHITGAVAVSRLAWPVACSHYYLQRVDHHYLRCQKYDSSA